MGPWIFASTVFLACVYLSIRFPVFRFWMARSVAAVLAIAVLIAGYIYIDGERENAKRKQAAQLIQPSDVELSGMTLTWPTYGTAHMKGTIKNNSAYEIKSIEFRVTISDCPKPLNCVTIGEDTSSDYVTVPSGQARALDTTIHFDDVPQATNWSWYVSITKIQAVPK